MLSRQHLIQIFKKEENKMAESMRGLKRSHRCAELNKANIGETVTVMGWVQKNRNKGGIVFVDLRDRSHQSSTPSRFLPLCGTRF